MQKLPDSTITIDRIAKAAEAFKSTVEGTPSEKKRTVVGTDLDSLLKMASLFAESTMT